MNAARMRNQESIKQANLVNTRTFNEEIANMNALDDYLDRKQEQDKSN